jgi:serine/threonine protein kinase/ankyrin repeat protein
MSRPSPPSSSGSPHPRTPGSNASPAPGVSPSSAASASQSIIGPYTIGPTIGAGIFAEVKCGTDEFRQQVAIKVFNKNAIKAKQSTQQHASAANASSGVTDPYQSHQFLQIEKEINALRVCDHPNIVSFYDVLETETKVFLVMEHLPHGELYDYILDKGKLSEAEASKLFGQVVSAITHCHALGIIHRDLKPENILMSQTDCQQVKIVDFGLANYWNPQEDRSVRSLRTQCGSPHYASPEVLRGERYSGPLADIWSLGVLLYAMVCGSLPFNARSIPMLIKKIVEGRFKLPKFLSKEVQHLIQTILQIVPENRPTLAQIAAHPWMQQHRASSASEQEEAYLAASKLKPLSRPEIISPQSYVNAKPTVLFGLAGASASQGSKGYLTANVHGTPSQEGELDSAEEEEDDALPEEDDEDGHPPPAGSKQFIRTPHSSISAAAAPAHQKRSPNEPHLPPSSALSFKPEAQYLNGADVADFSGGAAGGEARGRAIPQSSVASLKSSRDSFVASSPSWPVSAAGSLVARAHPHEQRQARCKECGKTLRLRTGDSGVLLLSSSVSAQRESHLTSSIAEEKEQLCQCAATNDLNAAGASAHPHGSAAPARSSIDTTAAFSPATPTRQSSDGRSTSAAGAGAGAGGKRSSPVKPLTKEELQLRERLYKDRCEALFKAAEKGDERALLAMLEQDASKHGGEDGTDAAAGSSSSPPLPPLDVRVTTVDSWNSLHYSARYGHAGVVRLLLTCWQPLDINSRTKQGWTPLMLAADQGHVEVVNVLLKYGAAIHVINNSGKSAIFLSRESGHAHIAQILTNASSARHLKWHQSGLLQASSGANGQNAADGAQVRELNHEFYRAAECGDLAKVRHLLQLGKEPSSSSSATNGAASNSTTGSSNPGDSTTPRTPMARRQSPQVASPDPSYPASSPTSASAGIGAAVPRPASSTSPTPRYCVDILSKGIDNWSVLHFAARKGRTKVVELLLGEEQDPPAEVNAVTKNLWTPLMLAADRGHKETCEILLRRGADPNCTSMDGYTALSVAQEGGHKEIVAMLSKYTSAKPSPTSSAAAGATPSKSSSRQPIVTPVNSPTPK